MKVKNFFTALVVLALGGAVGGAAYLLPSPPATEKELPGVAATDGTISLICTGGAERLIPQVGSTMQTEEKIQGWAGAFLSGVDLNAAAATWIPGSDADKKAIASPVLGTDYTAQTGLQQPMLQGSILIKRGQADGANMSGGSAHLAQAGDLRGIANNPCRWAASAAWFVGGSVKIGEASRLFLVNPSPNPMLIHISQYTEKGKQELGSGSNINLAPHAAKTVSLDGILADGERSALHVYSDSGFFAASLQTNSLTGYTPRGIDFLDAGVSGKDLVIPGLHLPAGDSLTAEIPDAAARGEESSLVAAGVKASLRIVNTEEKTQEVRIFTIDRSGKRAPLAGSEQVQVAGQAVLDLNLDGLKPGDYTLQLESGAAIAAGVQLAYETENGTDIAWLAAQPELKNSAVAFALGTGRLIMTPATAGSTSVQWEAFDANGKSLAKNELTISGTSGIDLPDKTTYVNIAAERPLYGGVIVKADVAGGKGIDWLPLTPDIASSSSFSLHGVN